MSENEPNSMPEEERERLKAERRAKRKEQPNIDHKELDEHGCIMEGTPGKG